MSDPERLVFIGDSLTEWYDWQARFPAHAVLNLGVAGETVEGLANRLDRIILSLAAPDYIFLMTGINNVAMEDYDILHEFKRIVNKLFSVYGRARIVIQSLLPVDLPWVDQSAIANLNETLKDLSKNYPVDYLDVHSVFLDTQGQLIREYLTEDGVHISDKGYEAWAGLVAGYLEKKAA